MEERGDKTIMCSVLFLDIVEYSKKSVSGQIALKNRFNSYLSAAIRDMPVADRIILDTGDGAAINFLGDVEDALITALSLRESILGEDPSMNPPLLVRAGINLGPVRLVRDINGQPNIVGDGINVAQRIMGFADVGQILVSRSYYDAVSRLSSQYIGMFTFHGSRTDKHVREHEVYAIGQLGDKTAKLTASSVLAAQESGPSAPPMAFARGGWNAIILWSTRLMAFAQGGWNAMVSRSDNAFKNLKSRFKQAGKGKRALYAGVLAVSAVLLGVLILTLGGRDGIPVPPDTESTAASSIEPAAEVVSVIPAAPVVESRTPEASPAQPATALNPDAKKLAKSKSAPKKTANSKADRIIDQPTADKPTTDQPAADQPASDQPRQVTSQRKSATTEPTEKKSWLDDIIGGNAQQQGAQAHVSVKCSPGTQVFVDGTQKGKLISRTLVVDVSPDKHTVIVTSASGEIYSQTVNLSEGGTASIRPGFCN